MTFPVVSIVPFDQPATTIDELLALGRPIVIAHTGGEDAYPGSTMYAFSESIADGADVLDLNVVLAGDGTLVVQHDLDVDRTSNGTGDVADLTFDELHALDIAYWFTLDAGADHDAPVDDYVWRGVRTGDVPPPDGYTADDFGMLRLEDLFDAFPNVPLNIEVKDEGERGVEAADTVVDLARERGRADAVVVSSFDDSVIDHVIATAPDIETSPGPLAAADFFFNGTPLPHGQRILQLPPVFGDLDVLTPANVAAAHEAGYVIWVWPNDRDLENEQAYLDFLDQGMDGLNINQPAAAVAAIEGAGTAAAGYASTF